MSGIKFLRAGTARTEGARDRIKALMAEKNIIAADICRATNLDNGNLSRFLAGKYKSPTFEMVKACLDFVESK